jgi:cellobiose transport system substrate-binding protein
MRERSQIEHGTFRTIAATLAPTVTKPLPTSGPRRLDTVADTTGCSQQRFKRALSEPRIREVWNAHKPGLRELAAAHTTWLCHATEGKVTVRTTRRSWVSLTAAMAGIALVATGCSSDDDGSDEATATSGEDVTLTLATFNEFGYADLVEEYMELNPNVTIERIKAAQTGDARTALVTSLGAGSGAADVEAIEVDWLPELLQYSDNFMDLTDPSVDGRWLDWKVAQATTPDGKLIGYGTDIGPMAICYRADLFEKAGLPTDRAEVADLLGGDGATWDKYFEVGDQFVAADTGAGWFDSAGAVYFGMINQVENAYEENDGTVIVLDNPEVKSIYDQVLAASETQSAHLGQWSEDWTNSFQKDGFATMQCPAWMLGIIEGNAAGVEGWDVADVFPGGGGNWGGSFLTVPEMGANKPEAKALAAWLTAPEQQIKAFQAKGPFPSQNDALSSPELAEVTNEFFADAPTGEIMANRANAVTVQPFKGTEYFKISDAMQNALTRVDVEQTDTPEESWKKFEDAVKSF